MFWMLFVSLRAKSDDAVRERRIPCHKSTTTRCTAIVLVFLMCGALTAGQPLPEQRTQMVEQVFRNVTVLKGIPVNEFMATMGFFSASLGENCTFCHVQESGGNWARYADDNANKVTARRMIGMVEGINKMYFGGRRVLTCYSCHRGGDRPRVTPSLADLYGPPLMEEPDTLVPQAPKAPAPDVVLDKYIQALGGAQALAKLTSFTAKGTYEGYAEAKRTFELFAKAPNQRSAVIGTGAETTTTTFDGRAGWIASPLTERPVPVLDLTGGDLDGARLDAVLSFPGQIKQALNQWRSGFPGFIDDREVQILQGTGDGRFPVNLYFDSKTGLLVRQVRYTDSPVGLAPTQIDYADYKDVAGIKMPHKITTTWLDGRSTMELTEVRPNSAVDASKFARPAGR
jgi:photosynthetic reaction center cytochrome c subunit